MGKIFSGGKAINSAPNNAERNDRRETYSNKPEMFLFTPEPEMIRYFPRKQGTRSQILIESSIPPQQTKPSNKAGYVYSAQKLITWTRKFFPWGSNSPSFGCQKLIIMAEFLREETGGLDGRGEEDEVVWWAGLVPRLLIYIAPICWKY